MLRRPPRSTQSRSSAASDVYKRQGVTFVGIPSCQGMRQERCKFLRHGWGSDDIFAPLPYLNRVCDFFQREVPGATVESQFLCGTGDTLPERFGQIRTEHILDVRSLEYGLVDVGSFLCHTDQQ